MSALVSLFSWLPPPFDAIAVALVVIFLLWSLLCLIRMIMDILPFV